MRHLASVLLLALLAIGLWFALGPDGGSAGPGAVVPTAEPQDPAPVGRSGPEAQVGPGLSDQQPAVDERVAVEAAPVELTLPEGVSLTEPDPAGLPFRVVHAETGAPVPGAHLIYMGSAVAMSEGAEELLAAGSGIDAVLERFGRHYRCDEAGEVRIGDLEADALVRARGVLDGELLAGLLEVDRNLGDVIEVPVQPELGFAVTVVDPSDAPVEGAKVELQIVMEFEGGAMRYPVNAAVTDRAGRAFLSNLLLEMGEESLGMVGTETRTAVVLSGFYAEHLEVDVDWETTSPSEVRLVQPPVGRVQATVVDNDGTGFTSGYIVLVPTGERTDPDVGPPQRSLYRSIQMAEDSTVVFDAVQREVPIDLVLGSMASSELASVDGLELAADQALLEVELVAGALPRLVGRAIDEEGRPLAEVELVVGREQSWSGTIDRLDRITTDPDGRFDLPAPWVTLDNLVLVQPLEGGEECRAVLGSLADLAALSPTVVLGDVVLQPPGLLAAGRVVDSTGQGRAVPLTLMVAELPGGEDRGNFESYRRWQAMSAPDGSFEFRGDSPAVRLRLQTTSEDQVSDPLIFDTGRADLRLEFLEAARVTFSLPSVDEDLLAAIFVVTEPVGYDGRNGRTYSQAEDGTSEALAPGERVFRLLLGADDDAVLYETVVLLQPGEVRDLGPLQLTRGVHRYEVALDLPEDIDPFDVYVRAHTQGPDGERAATGYSRRTPEGGWILHTVEPATHVRLSHDDLGEPAEFALAEGLNTLRLDF